jgi:hypothetical protein
MPCRFAALHQRGLGAPAKCIMVIKTQNMSIYHTTNGMVRPCRGSKAISRFHWIPTFYHILLIWIGSQHFALLERILCYIISPPIQVPRAPSTFNRQKTTANGKLVGTSVGICMLASYCVCRNMQHLTDLRRLIPSSRNALRGLQHQKCRALMRNLSVRNRCWLRALMSLAQ